MKFTLMTASAALLALGACTTPTESTTTSPDHLALYEEAVMIDTRDPLDVGEGASRVENLDYVNSWKPKG